MENTKPFIKIPEKLSEFECQANIYFMLKQAGIKVRGNITAYHNDEQSIFDLVVLDDNNIPKMILEVKDTPNLSILYGQTTYQIRKYQQYQLPILLCTPVVSDEMILSVCKKVLIKESLTKGDKSYNNMKIVH